MRFWIREVLGWALILLGLFVLYVDLSLLLDEPPRYLAAMIWAPAGIFIFRGGIQILKVSVAARMCAIAQSDLKKQDTKRPIGTPAKETIGGEW